MPAPAQRYAAWSPFYRSLPAASDWQPTLEQARARAAVLAGQHPGLVFYVICIVGQAEFPLQHGVVVLEDY